MCRPASSSIMTEIMCQSLLLPLLETLESMLELTGAMLLDACPEVMDVHLAAREPSGASALTTALFTQTWALEDTVRLVRHHIEEVAMPSPGRVAEPFFPDLPF